LLADPDWHWLAIKLRSKATINGAVGYLDPLCSRPDHQEDFFGVVERQLYGNYSNPPTATEKAVL
jgi:hypothetical protein